MQSNYILNNGKTLIEVMLLGMIVAILVAIIFSTNMFHVKTAFSPDKTSQDMLIINNGMKFYKLDNGRYPSTEQGIKALFIKPTIKPIPSNWRRYIKSIPIDKDGKPYKYIPIPPEDTGFLLSLFTSTKL